MFLYIEDMKTCIICKQELPLEQFYRDKSSKDGLGYKCKQCQKQYIKQRYQDNPERQKQYLKQWNKDNPDYVKDNYRYSIEPGIYMIKCLVNGKRYIGKSNQPYQRKASHFSIRQSSVTDNTNPQLQHDLQQYGKNAFIWGIIEHCDKSELSSKETYYIKTLCPEYNWSK